MERGRISPGLECGVEGECNRRDDWIQGASMGICEKLFQWKHTGIYKSDHREDFKQDMEPDPVSSITRLVPAEGVGHQHSPKSFNPHLIFFPHK